MRSFGFRNKINNTTVVFFKTGEVTIAASRESIEANQKNYDTIFAKIEKNRKLIVDQFEHRMESCKSFKNSYKWYLKNRTLMETFNINFYYKEFTKSDTQCWLNGKVFKKENHHGYNDRIRLSLGGDEHVVICRDETRLADYMRRYFEIYPNVEIVNVVNEDDYVIEHLNRFDYDYSYLHNYEPVKLSRDQKPREKKVVIHVYHYEYNLDAGKWMKVLINADKNVDTFEPVKKYCFMSVFGKVMIKDSKESKKDFSGKITDAIDLLNTYFGAGVTNICVIPQTSYNSSKYYKNNYILVNDFLEQHIEKLREIYFSNMSHIVFREVVDQRMVELFEKDTRISSKINLPFVLDINIVKAMREIKDFISVETKEYYEKAGEIRNKYEFFQDELYKKYPLFRVVKLYAVSGDQDAQNDLINYILSK